MKHLGATEPNTPALRVSIKDVIREYEAKRADIPSAVERFEKAKAEAEAAASVGGAYVGSIFRGGVYVNAHQWEENLLKSAWRHIYDGLQIGTIASARDRDRIKTFLEAPEPFTLENIRKHFGDYIAAPRWNILKGLAECFAALDPAYKSHSNVKIGVAGLPKRVIVSGVATFHGYGVERVKDVFRVLANFRGVETLSDRDFADLLQAARRDGEASSMGITIKTYRNGNAHLIFDKSALLDINRALAEFYGDVLPDSPEASPTKKPGTAVSADLAYYPSPGPAIEVLLGDTYIKPGSAVLEPSCGDGRVLKAVLAKEPSARTVGVEVHPGRANTARESGLSVRTANFLEVAPEPVFDLVLMNPPFCGKHYQKHVEHAKKFLKPGGVLKAILPASAKYDHGYVGNHYNAWCDLPPGSFRESGTGIPTGVYTYAAPRD